MVEERITAREAEEAIAAANVGSLILEDVKLFDVYRGKGVPEGKKSMAYSYVLRAEDRTLNEEDISGAMEAILASVKERVGGELRS